MAELVGLVAGGITLFEFAGTVASSVLRLKRLWDEVKVVPEAIREVLKRLEVLVPILAEMEKDFLAMETTTPSSSAAVLSMQYCHNAVTELKSVVESISHNVESAKRLKRDAARFKVVLKKDEISKYEKKLEWAIQLLLFAQQQHTIATLRLQPKAIVQCLASAEMVIQSKISSEEQKQDRSSNSQPVSNYTPVQSNLLYSNSKRACGKLQWATPSFFGSFVYSSSVSRQDDLLGQGHTNYCARIQLPRWVTNRAWEIIVSPRLNISLRAYSVVPETSPIFECVREGNTDQMLQLFRGGVASPYDRNERGFNLVEMACAKGRLEILRILLQFDDQSLDNMDCLLRAILGLRVLASEGSPSSIEYAEFLVSKGAFCQDSYNSEGWHRAMVWSWRALSLSPAIQCQLLPFISPNHYKLSALDRLQHIDFDFFHPDSLRLSLQPNGPIIAEDVQELQHHGISLASIVAFFSTASLLDGTGQEWRKLRRDAIASTASLTFQQGPLDLLCRGSQFWHGGFSIGTALCALIMGFHPCQWATQCLLKGPFISKLNRVLFNWLEDLQSAQVDLVKYGRNEAAILAKISKSERTYYSCHGGRPLESCSSSSSIFRDWCRVPVYYGFCSAKLESFSYGPTLRDWSFEWDFFVEEFAGEFWSMIEDPPLRIPGSWVEDDNIWRDAYQSEPESESDVDDESDT